MAEYIDREALLHAIANDVAPFNVAMVFRHIHNAEIVDVAPVRHGRWIYHEETMYTIAHTRCSACKRKRHEHPFSYFTYCPYCGAKMDKGDE